MASEFDPTKRCRGKSGSCQNLVSKKAWPTRLCQECYDKKLERRARTAAQPDCGWDGCRQKVGQGQQFCGLHRRDHEEHLARQDEVSDLFSQIGGLDASEELKEILRRIVDRVFV